MLSALNSSDVVSDLIALASLVISLIALAVAVFALRKGDLNASAATLVSLNEAFRDAWARFLSTQDDAKQQYEFSELINLIEIGCAIYVEKSLTGVARELMEEYLHDVLKLIEGNPSARSRIEPMRHSPTTLKYTKKFLYKMLRSKRPHPMAQALGVK